MQGSSIDTLPPPGSKNGILTAPLEKEAAELYAVLLEGTAPCEREVTVAQAVDALSACGLYPCVCYVKKSYPYVGPGYFEYRCDASSGATCAGGICAEPARAWQSAVREGLRFALMLRTGVTHRSEFYL